MNSYENSSF